MTAYRVQISRKILDATDTTACVLAFEIDQARSARHVTGGDTSQLTRLSVGVFSLNGFSFNVPEVTLSSSIIGAEVYVEDTDGKWRRGKVARIGDSALDPNGATILGTARATRPVIGTSFPAVGVTLLLAATAEDGTQWFVLNGKPRMRCAALQTVADLGSGRALVEKTPDSGEFIVMDL